MSVDVVLSRWDERDAPPACAAVAVGAVAAGGTRDLDVRWQDRRGPGFWWVEDGVGRIDLGDGDSDVVRWDSDGLDHLPELLSLEGAAPLPAGLWTATEFEGEVLASLTGRDRDRASFLQPLQAEELELQPWDSSCGRAWAVWREEDRITRFAEVRGVSASWR